MRKYLLPELGNFYKANLHCHTTVSDGAHTPEEIKERYKANGYSIVAYTDHNKLVTHSELCDESFVALNGYEYDALDDKRGRHINVVKTCHICLVATRPDITEKPDVERIYTPETINKLISEGRKAGFFVTYNHPAWSLEDYRDYSRYHGMHAMEICNNSSYITGMFEYNPHVYDEMLREGERIYCIAADDNHSVIDSCGAFTMIKAERLSYECVTKALLDGHFYASRGPRIEALYAEGNKITVECDDAAAITFNTAGRHRLAVCPQDNEPLTSASFEFDEADVYVRITVVDKQGRTANTNAYFLDELNLV